MKRFTESHEWIEVEGDVGTVGITGHAQEELGEIVYVQPPKVGHKVKGGEEAAILESTKAAADIYSPVSGEVIAINDQLKEAADTVNHSPEDQGWIFKIKLANPEELTALLDETNYQSLIKLID